jgi:hypothetical protein
MNDTDRLAQEAMKQTTEACKRKMTLIQPIPILGAGKFKKRRRVREEHALNRLVSALLEDEPA